MKVRKGMNTPSRRPLSLAVAAVLLTAGAAYAEPMFQAPLYRGTDMSRYSENFIELGGAYNTDDSYKFGQWTGITDKGGYVLGNFNYSNQGLGDNRNYFWANGQNLGFDSRTAALGYTSQGVFSAYGSYQGLPFYASDSTSFIFNGLGGTNLTARTGIVNTPNTNPNIANINNALVPFDLDTQRDVWRVGGKFLFGGNWDVYANYRQDNVDGNKLQYGGLWQSGGNPKSNALAVPVSETTYQFDAGLRWNGETAQAQLSYWYSKYSPDNNSLTWQNPFSNTAWTCGAACNYPNSYGQMGLDPGNTFNQVTATGAWNFAQSWRLNSSLQYSWARQDDNFLAYYAPIGYAPNAGTVRNPATSSLDGKVDRWLFNVGVNGRVLPGLTLRAKYTYDDNSNKTSSSAYYPAPGSLGQTITGAGVTNTPIGSYTINRFSVEADYALMARTMLRGNYTYVNTKWEDEDRSRTYDNIFGLELRQTASEFFTGFLKYTYWQRTGNDYTFPTLPPNPPFFINNFVQNRVRAQGDIGLSETVNLTLAADWTRRNYNDPSSGLNCSGQTNASPDGSGCVGLQDASWTTLTADLQFRPTEALTMFAFASYGDLSNEQLGKNASTAPQNPNNYFWTANLAQKSNTFGLGANYNVASQWDVGANWIYNQGKSDTALTWGPAIATTVPAPLQLPAATYNLQSFQLFGKWAYSKTITFRANWWYQKLNATDYAYDGVSPWASDRTVFTGQNSGGYSTNVFGLSVAYTGF